MKTSCPRTFAATALIGVSLLLPTPSPANPEVTTNSKPDAKSAQAIPWSEVGGRAGAQYQGDGLSIIPSERGAVLRCVFQKLEGEAALEGLWLTSTVSDAVRDRFRVLASAVGRVASPAAKQFAITGAVEMGDKLVRFARPGVIEEYSVSMDGVRQDFVILEKPQGSGELRLQLKVSGAGAEASPHGARLALENSGRKIAHSRLRVTDAAGRELPARMEVQNKSELRNPNSEIGLAVLVNDTDATYAIRIDPTFSDDNWISMGGSDGASGPVYAAVVDGSGNLYIGGNFNIGGDVFATNIAKWNGSSWSALGSGITAPDGNPYYGGRVFALAVSGSNLYAGGRFTTAGLVTANYIAKWNGSVWSDLGSGVGGTVFALAGYGSDLFAGGSFLTASGTTVNRIAKWDGGTWSALGSGIGAGDYYGGDWPQVRAIAVSGSNLYAGGYFTNAGGVLASNIAKWNGSSWSALGSGVSGPDSFFPYDSYPYYFPYYGRPVMALAVSGSDLYAGGWFTTAGGIAASNIAKWNGSSWSALGSGLSGAVFALAVSGDELYVGGSFTNAGGVLANNIANWDGSSWSALGSGINGKVYALAVSGTNLYAGGYFTNAGGILASNIAKWNGSSWSALGSGVSGAFLVFTYTEPCGEGPYVKNLAVSGHELYAGGAFATAGNLTVNHIAKWNGSNWSALGSGLRGPLGALSLSGSDLYVAGQFGFNLSMS